MSCKISILLVVVLLSQISSCFLVNLPSAVEKAKPTSVTLKYNPYLDYNVQNQYNLQTPKLDYTVYQNQYADVDLGLQQYNHKYEYAVVPEPGPYLASPPQNQVMKVEHKPISSKTIGKANWEDFSALYIRGTRDILRLYKKFLCQNVQTKPNDAPADLRRLSPSAPMVTINESQGKELDKLLECKSLYLLNQFALKKEQKIAEKLGQMGRMMFVMQMMKKLEDKKEKKTIMRKIKARG